MKALAIKQPWAWLIVNGYKPVENRTWSTKFRGPLLIHASASKPSKADYEAARQIFCQSGTDPNLFPEIYGFDLGGIVGMAVVTDVTVEHSSPYFFGPVGFVLEKARRCKLHPFKGALSFFETGLDKSDLKWRKNK